MRILNLNGRLALAVGDGAVDVATASSGRFGPDVQSVYDDWAAFSAWARNWRGEATLVVDQERLGPPAPTPSQVFAIGLNYRAHAMEAGLGLPETPVVFTKFPASIAGPYDCIGLPEGGSTDWEVELVVVMGQGGVDIPQADAWDHVAGITVGQDLSERQLQTGGPAPAQYSLGKSYAGFAPIGPTLVTPDEFADPDDLALMCALDGEVVQSARTADLIFPVPQLIAFLSRVLPLRPGDVIFTGTPSGIGATRTPARFITPDHILTTSLEGVGEMRHTFHPRASALA